MHCGDGRASDDDGVVSFDYGPPFRFLSQMIGLGVALDVARGGFVILPGVVRTQKSPNDPVNFMDAFLDDPAQLLDAVDALNEARQLHNATDTACLRRWSVIFGGGHIFKMVLGHVSGIDAIHRMSAAVPCCPFCIFCETTT